MNFLHQCPFEKLKVGHTCLQWAVALACLASVGCMALAVLANLGHIPKDYGDTYMVAFCPVAIVTLAVYLFYERVASVYRERRVNRQEFGLPV